jgi:hypothetical protein
MRGLVRVALCSLTLVWAVVSVVEWVLVLALGTCLGLVWVLARVGCLQRVFCLRALFPCRRTLCGQIVHFLTPLLTMTCLVWRNITLSVPSGWDPYSAPPLP